MSPFCLVSTVACVCVCAVCSGSNAVTRATHTNCLSNCLSRCEFPQALCCVRCSHRNYSNMNAEKWTQTTERQSQRELSRLSELEELEWQRQQQRQETSQDNFEMLRYLRSVCMHAWDCLSILLSMLACLEHIWPDFSPNAGTAEPSWFPPRTHSTGTLTWLTINLTTGTHCLPSPSLLRWLPDPFRYCRCCGMLQVNCQLQSICACKLRLHMIALFFRRASNCGWRRCLYEILGLPVCLSPS